MQSGRRFVYKPRSEEVIRQRAERPTSNFVQLNKPDFKRYTPKAGLNKLRFMPPTWEDAASYALDLIVHYNVGPDGDRYLCAKMRRKPCAICEERIKLARQGETEASKLVRPQDGRASWVIDRTKEEDGPQIWFFGRKMDTEFAIRSLDQDTRDVLHIDDPDEGYDISFHAENPGIHVQYSGEQVSRRSSPLCANARKQEEWLDYITRHPIPDCLQFYPYKTLLETMHGAGGADIDEEDNVTPLRRQPSLRNTEPEEEDTPFDEETGEILEGDVEDERGPVEEERGLPGTRSGNLRPPAKRR